MPSIRILDQLNVDLISAEAGPSSGFAKYFKGDVAGFVASTELATAFNKPLTSLGGGPIGFGLRFKTGGNFGGAQTEWSLEAGAAATIEVVPAGEPVFGDATFGDPALVPDGRAFLTVAFSPSLAVGISHQAGDLTFGFAAGSTAEIRAGLEFEVEPVCPSLGSAVERVLTRFSIPGDTGDLLNMPVGAVSSVSGSGRFSASASFDLMTALNPLAVPALGLPAIGKLELKAGASVTVGASVGFSGRYQVRVRKLDAQRVRLGYHKARGSEFGFEIIAKAGATVTAGKRDLAAMLLGRLGGAPTTDAATLVDAGLSDEQIAELREAVAASVDRSLNLALAGSLAALKTDEALFEYEFDLTALDPDGQRALHRALDGDLSELSAKPPDALPKGVVLRRSQFESVKSTKVVWKINLLGIVNVLSITELIRKGKVSYDSFSGDLVISDSVTYKAIHVESRPLEAEPARLRRALMQSLILTAAYRVSGLLKMVEFGATQSFFELTGKTRKQTISDYLDAFVGLELITTAEKAAFLNATFTGTSTLLVESTFNDTSFAALFLDSGRPITQEEYDRIGRASMRALVQPGDENDFRRIVADDDALWAQMVDQGPFQMKFVLPPALRTEPRFSLIQSDYTMIRWWSAAMSRAAIEVAEMKEFIDAADAASVNPDNNEFKKHRKKLGDALADVVSRASPPFLDAWGVLAMDSAARGQAAVRCILVTTDQILVKNRP